MQVGGQKLKNPSARMLVYKLGKSMKNNQNGKVIGFRDFSNLIISFFNGHSKQNILKKLKKIILCK